MILGLRSCRRDESQEIDTENMLDTHSDSLTDATEESGLVTTDEATEADPTVATDNDQIREPIVFCGASEPEDADILSHEAALSYLALVNRCYRLASDFSPDDLSTVNVAGVNFPFGNDVHQLRETAARALEDLFQEADANGLELIMSSGYRSYDLQVFFHNQAIDSHGVEVARRISAIPGHSEHQLGLAVDLTTPVLEVYGWLHEDFSTTPEGIWINENAHYFGFILSFPPSREEDTGIIYEPWHIRYVGVEVATEIVNNGQILEEFLWYNN